MKLDFQNRTPNPYEIGLVLAKPSIQINGKFTRQWVIAMRVDFKDKDEAKAWAKAHGGSWHPIEKFWYAPASKLSDIIRLVKSALEMSHILSHDNTLSFFIQFQLTEAHQPILQGIQSCFEQEEKAELTRLHEVQPHQETVYNTHPASTLMGEDIAQWQGFANGQRVVAFREQPTDYQANVTDELEQMTTYRIYRGEDGNHWYCRPWQNPVDNFDIGCWSDLQGSEFIADSSDIQEEVKPEPELNIALVIEGNTPIAFRCTITKGAIHFHQLLDWCKKWEGRKWVAHHKAWDIPFGENSGGEIHKLKEIWGEDAIALSPGVEREISSMEAKYAR